MWIRRLSELAVVAAMGLASVGAHAGPPANDDPFADYRERFKQGMDRYKAGAFTEAIGYWEPIYAELGQLKGYRLAYNLGVAYEELGEATKGAEHLQSFLAQVDAKRAAGEAQPPIVQKEEADARDRMATLTASKGRIHVDPGNPPRATQVDAMEPRLATFVAWVNPGQHTVTFGPGGASPETRTLEVHAGEQVEVTPSAATPGPAPVPAPTSAPVAAPAPSPVPAPPFPPAAPSASQHPFPAAVLFVTGGLSLAAGIVSVPLELDAWSLHDRYAGQTSVSASDQSSFYSARTGAYVSIAAAVGLAAVTAGLTTWYFAGTSGPEVAVTPGGVAGRF
jgi:hypothetical protein